MNEAITTKTKLRAYLDDHGIRYSFVAERLGVSNGHLNHVLDGKRPLLRSHAETLAGLFNEPAETFLEDAA